MKKILSLAFMLLVATFAVDASAQSSKLVGKWNADVPAELLETGMFSTGDVKFTFEFESDGDCEIKILVGTTQALDASISLAFKLYMEFDYDWILSGDKLSMSNAEIDMELQEFKFIPSSPELDSMLPMIKQQIESEFNKEKGQIADQMVASDMKVNFVDDNTIVITPLDETTPISFTLRRVK